MIKQLSAGTISTTPRKFYSLQSDYSMHHSKVKTKKYSNSKGHAKWQAQQTPIFPWCWRQLELSKPQSKVLNSKSVKANSQDLTQSKALRQDQQTVQLIHIHQNTTWLKFRRDNQQNMLPVHLKMS